MFDILKFQLSRDIIGVKGVVVCESLLGENRRLVTDEPVEFEKWAVKVWDFRRITD